MIHIAHDLGPRAECHWYGIERVDSWYVAGRSKVRSMIRSWIHVMTCYVRE